VTKFIFTSFHPSFSFEKIPDGKTNKQFCKSLEGSYLWFLYIRKFFPKDYHIAIVDQNSDFDIDYLLKKAGEQYEILEENNFNFNPDVFLHIIKFQKKASRIAGVKRLYFWLYDFCLYNKTDMFFIEQDCFVAKDLSELASSYDFLTNAIHKPERVCDTYLCNIPFKRLTEKDSVFPLEEYVKNLKANDNYNGDVWQEDPVVMILCERGMYSHFCYGNIVSLNNDRNIHNCKNEEFLKFLKSNPIDHAFYYQFIEKINNCL
jgi:hypothetical protein